MEYDVITTDVFSKWARKLKDRQAARAIALRIARSRAGNLGDVSLIGDMSVKCVYLPEKVIVFISPNAGNS